MIGAGSHAVPASKTARGDLTYNTGFMVVISGTCRAYGYARRMVMAVALAVLAGPGNIRDVCVWEGETVGDLVDPHPEVTAQLIRFVFPEGYVVLSHTGHHAGPATRAFIQVNYHTVLVSLAVSFVMCLFMMCLFHGYPFLALNRGQFSPNAPGGR